MKSRGCREFMLAVALCGGVLMHAQACASSQVSPARTQHIGPNAGLFDGVDLKSVARHVVATSLKTAAVVVVGERHGDARFHAVQAGVLEWLSENRPAVAVAVEWLPFTAGQAVERWMNAPEKSVDSLATAVNWSALWGHSLDSYRPLLATIRSRGRELWPVNAPPGLSRQVARRQLKPIEPKWEHAIPPLDSANEPHFKRFSGLIRAAGHGHHGPLSDAMLRQLYQAQLVWDETMAYQIDQRSRGLDPGAVVVVFAGVGHTDFGHGIPERLRRNPVVTVRPAVCPGGAPPAELRGVATYVWCVDSTHAAAATRQRD